MTKPSQGRKTRTNGFPWKSFSFPKTLPAVVLFQGVLIVAACFWIFWPSVYGGWIWDDDLYIAGNPLLHDPHRLWKAWFEPGSFIEYYPIQQTVQWFQWKAFGEDTFGYHLTNIFLHAVNSLLVWRLFQKLGLRFAWLGGLLFAVHPMQVESVAWIAEFKNTLSMLPLLLAMVAWIDYQNQGRRSDYLEALGFFLVAMLCKVSMAPLPVFFFAYALWKRGKMGLGDLKEALPFLLISLVLGTLVIWSGQVYHERTVSTVPEVLLATWTERVSCAGQSLAFYFGRMVFPLNPLPLYRRWLVDGQSLFQFMPWAVMAGTFVWFWLRRATWGKHALLGITFFLLFLLPFVGFLPASYMRFSWVMDHFIYISILGGIGLFLAILQHGSGLISLAGRRAGVFLLAAYFFSLVTISHCYAGKYESLDALFSYALEQLPDSGMAHNNLGVARNRQFRLSEAIYHFETAVRLMPGDENSSLNLGDAYFNAGRMEDALRQYGDALKRWPNLLSAQLSQGDVLLDQHRNEEALAHYQKYLQLNPNATILELGLGNALFQMGRYAEAVDHYKSAIKSNINSALAHHNLGKTYRQLGQFQEAMQQYRLALGFDPNYVDAHINLGAVYYLLGDKAGAIHEYEAVRRIDPANPIALENLRNLRGY